MAAENRYTGVGLTLVFNGTTISADYTKFHIALTTKTEDKTAGADTDTSYNPTLRDGKWDMKLFDTGEFGTLIRAVLRDGNSGPLFIYPKGVNSGKPIMALNAIITDFDITYENAKNIEFEVKGVKNGPMIWDIDGVQA